MPHAPIVVYTCIAGLYDRELMPVKHEPGVEFVCFTDTPGKLNAPGWDLRKPQSPARLTDGHDINRFHKLFANRLFPEHRWSIYLDGNLRFHGQFHGLVKRLENSEQALGAFWHRNGHTLGVEVDACRRHKFDQRDAEVVRAQLKHYEAAGIALDQPIPTNNLLVRDHVAPGLSDAMSIWWSHLFEFSKRDQVSLLYALKAAGAGWQPLDGEGDDAVDTALVETVWHKPALGKRIERRLRKHFGITRKGKR